MKHFYKIENGNLMIGTGDVVPDGFKEYNPNNPPDEFKSAKLNQLKKEKKKYINNQYLIKSAEPIIYKDHTYQADENSQLILTKVIAAAPQGFETFWLDIKNEPVNMNLNDLKELAQTILNRNQALFKKKIAFKQQIDEAQTIQDVEKVVWK